MKETRSFRQRRRPPARRPARSAAQPRCAPMPSSANEFERRARTCASAMDAPLRGLARTYSPPVLMVALVLKLNELGRAHISAGLLTVDDLRDLVMDSCEFVSPTPQDTISNLKESRGGTR